MERKRSGVCPKGPIMDFTSQDLEDLKCAHHLLENPSLAARITGKIGLPIEMGFEMLPKGWSDTISKAVHVALGRAMDVAVMTLQPKARGPALNALHTMAVAASGAIGGAFGLASLPVELPISTTIMLRSIADVARSEGESLDQIASRLACLEVFALGGRTSIDDANDTSYFAIRSLLARTISEAAQFVAERGVAERSAPVLIRLIGLIANRFSTVVAEKIAAQAVPIIGAAGGAVVNAAFIDHFQNIARGHFIVRRLERTYGSEQVRQEYERLSQIVEASTPPAALPPPLNDGQSRPEA